MSKYDPLWHYQQSDSSQILRLPFDEIKVVLGFEIDHSFLSYKKETPPYEYQAGKISLKEKLVTFNKIMEG